MRFIMSALCQSFHVRQFFLIAAGFISFSVGFWPIPGFGHQAGGLYHKAVEAIQDENFQQADSFLQEAISNFPDYAEAHHLLGIVQYQLTQASGKAIPSLKRAIQLNSNFVEAHYHLGLLLLKQGKTKEAQQQFKQALTIYPGFWEARLTLGKTFDQQGATDKAIREYEAVLTQQPSASDALYLLGYHLMQRNQIDRAEGLLIRLTDQNTG